MGDETSKGATTMAPHPFVASNVDFDTRCVVCGCKQHRDIHAPRVDTADSEGAE